MNIIAVVPAALRALQAGRSLSNPAAWKQVQNVINFLTAGVTVAAAVGYTVPISDEGIATVAGGVVALVNVYFTVATTGRLGWPARRTDHDSNPPDPPAVVATDSGRAADADRDPGAVRAVVELRQPASVPAGGGSVAVDREPNTYPNLRPSGWGDQS